MLASIVWDDGADVVIAAETMEIDNSKVYMHAENRVMPLARRVIMVETRIKVLSEIDAVMSGMKIEK